MEQKKTLWIIAAVGVFLLVVLGAAMILYPPSVRSAPAVATITPVERKNDSNRTLPREDIHSAPVKDGFEQVPPQNPLYKNQDNLNGFEGNSVPAKENPTLRVNDLFVVSENTTVYDASKNSDNNSATTIDLNSLKNELQQQVQPPVSNINITVNLPEQDVKTVENPSVIVVPVGESKNEANSAGSKFPVDKRGNDGGKKNNSSKAGDKSEAKKSSNAVAASNTSSNKSSNTASSSKASTANVSEQKPVTRFWVQVAAYSNKKTAENARTVLDDNKIPADIFTYQDNKEKLFYRVRVGPYTTKSEAEYWKSKIEKIDAFVKAGSYVTSSVD